MTTPGAATPGGQWWVISQPSGARGGPPQLLPVQATSPPPNKVAGPFPTEDAARQWILANENQGPSGFPPLPSIPNPFAFLAALGWIQEIGHWLGILIAAATDLHTYISIGWLLLGFWLLVIGILLWLRIPQRVAGAAKSAAKDAAAAAVVA